MEPEGMRSVTITMMVAAMLLLRTAAYPGYPGQTTELKLDTTTEGTTSELPTTTEPPTTTELPTTTETPTTTTTSCEIVTCGPNCGYISGIDGCPRCDCHPTCMDVTCDPYERCIMQDVPQCYQARCYPVPTCIRFGPPTETPTWPPPTETPTPPPTWTIPADCPYSSSSCPGECEFHVDYTSGQCPTCDCPVHLRSCTSDSCPTGEQCVENSECTPDGRCYDCVIIDPTFPPTPMTPGCPTVECNGYPFCSLEDSPWDGCPVCVCTDPACMMQGCPPGQQCLPTGECPACYTCQGTIEPTCQPIPPLPYPPGCIAYEGSDGCITAACYTCDDAGISCGEDTTCELQICDAYPCPPPVICVPTTEPPTSTTYPPPHCPPPEWCPTDYCQLETILNGCQICDCPAEVLCTLPTCASSQECDPDHECYNGKCYACNYVTTTELPTTTTTSCEIVTCGPNCGYAPGANGCPRCECHPDQTCQSHICPEGEECVATVIFCNADTCFYRPDCYPKNETTTWPTTWTTTPPSCPDVSFCAGETCQLEYSSEGCPNCRCYYMFCQVVSCFSSEECNFGSQQCYGGRCYSCYDIDHTPSPPTPPTCSSTSCDSSPLCHIDYSSGNCDCVCVDPECMLEGCPPGQACLPNGECDTCYSCLPDVTTPTTTETTTETTTWTTTWTTINCWTSTCGLYCAFGNKLGSNGCPACDCNPEDACLFQFQPFSCSGGEECVPRQTYCNKDTCFYEPSCSPKNDTDTPTPSPTTTPTCVSDFSCPEECTVSQDSNGCPQCNCSSPCELVDCRDGYVCEEEVYPCLIPPCPTHAVCVPINTPTTSEPPTPCPMVTCGPDCVSDTGSDGCTTCECPPSCKTVKCSAGHECQLVNVTCIRYPCFPQPQCVQVEDPCTGTPNPGRCGRGSKTRWTYNSLTDTCESFRYYGCTPSPNTFRSRKECRNKCSGNSQIVCPDLACAEDSCYTLERKNNKCPLCICPNPCKEFHCRRGYECKMRESKCSKGAKPFCAKIPCPPQDPCGIRCMYGLKTDKNGCQLCECLEAPRSYP